MEYAADLDLTLIDHCEDPHLARGWRMHEGVTSGLLGVKGQPAAGEAVQAARDIMLAEYLQLLSTLPTFPLRSPWTSLPGARRASAVTAETCPHYLLLDETALDRKQIPLPR